MGIRYYAYAFDAELTDAALADPERFTSDDPLADAWGMPHGAQIATTNFEQSVPKTEMLYLDKAWSYLQALTRPVDGGDDGRPSFRMFEGPGRQLHSGVPRASGDVHSADRRDGPRFRLHDRLSVCQT
ncbi:MAG: hypothetical protein BGN97_14110 [Microbacterium sp. 69-10]|uniref:hypothetical protein n=1 Tax=Microbacterium sp. 69-10 TaxID=1895783 RepID=UPI0009619160|nr:hypothetical protein [Microbacterium sp. 69-10]OJU39953.1 MAG: hypothetical protein BGN97_14110 [Microbacterium sp. 69-10]